MRNRSTFVLIFSLCSVLTGCGGYAPSVTTSTSPLAPGIRGTVPAYGSDCQPYFLGVVPLTFAVDTQLALTRAKVSANSDVLTDVTVDENSSYYILFSNRCVRVRGLGVPRSGTTITQK